MPSRLFRAIYCKIIIRLDNRLSPPIPSVPGPHVLNHMDLHEKYETVIGLEVHAQLLTNTKTFSPEPAVFGGAPNTYIDAVSLAHPGTLPVLNEKVVELTLRTGLATHCKIRSRSVFARKHYFYPDLPKGYQISQYEDPICYDGYVEITDPERHSLQTKRIGLTRIHMEEDAGKSIHDQDPYNTLIDLNRCGVPLIEMVSEPDIRSPREAYLYLTKLRQIVRYLGVCDGNMEEGSLRCDANVSVRLKGETRLGTKTELKNMNSFRNVERGLTYEVRRQIEVLEAGGTIHQETRLWDPNKMQTRVMRTKESAHDYRYFPDPDLVQVVVTAAMLDRVKAQLPELPEARRARYQKDLGLPAYDAEVLTEERAVSEYFEATLAALDQPDEAKAVSNFVMTDVLRILNEQAISIDAFSITPARLADLIRLRLEGTVSSTGAQEIFDTMLQDAAGAEAIARARNLLQVSDTDALLPVIEAALDKNPRQVDQYLGGKTGLLGFFIGQVMRNFEGSPDPKVVRQLLNEKLEARRG